MAAHSPLTTVVPPVAPDQPATAWSQWLRDMAQAINLIATRHNNPSEEVADTVILTGDATGSGAGTIDVMVQGLQGQPVSATAPGSSQVLQWSGAAWTPATISLGGGSGTGDVDSVTAGTGLVGGGTGGDILLALATPVAVAHGGTGAVTAPAARVNLGAEAAITLGTTAQYWRGDKSWQALNKAAVGLGNVDNTSDINKPISTATQTALNLKAPLANPIFTGVPAAPTATVGTSTTQLATTAFVSAAVGESGGGTITGVTAGTGLTGGGTIGTVVLNLSTPVAIANGGTGAVTASTALAALGGAPLASPAFTGNPTAPTPPTADSDNSIATTAFVKAQGYAPLIGSIVSVTSTTSLPAGTTGWVFVSAAAPLTVTLPSASPTTGQTLVVKDVIGSAGTYPITVNGGGRNIDGAATLVLSVNYSWIRLVYDGTRWAQV